MAEAKNTRQPAGMDSSREDSYRLAKMIRAGKRELARQLNLKKARRQR